mgnify:FL=1
MYNNRYMNFLKKNLAVIFLTLVLIVLPIFSFAQGKGSVDVNPKDPTTTSGPARIENPLESKGINSINGLIKVLLTGVLRIGTPIVALAIIYSGFLFVFARGNSEGIKKAKETLMYTLIGSAILLGSWAIAQLISNTVLSL